MKTFRLSAVLFGSLLASAFAGSATWNLNPTSNDWNTAANWTPATVPNGASDVATFATSNTAPISLSAAVAVDSIVFNPGASSYQIGISPTGLLTFRGPGVTNNSTSTENFVIQSDNANRIGFLTFRGNASAGDLTTYTAMGATAGLGGHGVIQFYDETTAGSGTFVTQGSTVTGDADAGTIIFIENATAGTANFTNKGGTKNLAGGGLITFSDQASAADASFVNNGSTNAGLAGFISFHDNSTAGSASFITNGAKTGDRQANIWFYDQATAGNATFTNPSAEGLGGGIQFYGTSEAGSASFNLDDGSVIFWESSSAANATINLTGGDVFFGTTSTAANATIIATGGTVIFINTATGGNCRINLLGSSSLDLSNREVSSTTIGSLEGSAIAFLGQYNLAIGSNNLSTTFSGSLRDGGTYQGRNASITKIGTGTLSLSGANTYTGGTTVSDGTLLVKNTTGSATGTAAVQVSGGILGGRGIISGATTIGSGSGIGGSLQPGKGANNPTTLTLQNTLTFESDGIYTWKLNTKKAQADQVVANGVTIDNGAQFDFSPVGNKRLTVGIMFTPISNTSTGAISGTFVNLVDGSIVTVGVNKLQVSYSGGDGNDLTLTVVP